MSSAADPADAPSGTSATEFVLEEFETTIPPDAINDLAECITEVIQNLRAAVVSDERLESILRGDPGPDILHGADLTEHGDPEPFTQRAIIEPLFDVLGYPEFTTEASGLSEAQRKKADYIFSLREYDDIDSRRLPVEAEPLNKKLDQEAHGIGQVKEWLDTYSFEAEFALAVDGVRWTLIKYDRERYQYDTLAEIDLQPVFVAAFENAVGQQASPAEWLDDADEALLEDFVRSFGFENFCAIAGDARTVIKETKSAITDAFYDEYVRRVFGVLDESASEGDKDGRTDFSLVGDGIIAPEAATGDDIRLFSVELMNRLIFIKFLEDKHVVDAELLRGLWKTYEDGVYPDRFYSTFLTRLFYDVFDTKPTNRTRQVRSVDLFDDIPYLDGGLFRPRTAGWEGEGVEESAFDVRDSVLESIIGLLERYTFSADGGPRDLDPSVLGNVFEKTINYITTDPGDQNKELGAYYTPDQITRFCADRTVRPALFDRFKRVLHEERGWQQAEVEHYEDVEVLIEDLPPSEDLIHALLDATDSLRVVDPACGSGHFLTSALEEIVSVRRALYTQIEATPPGYRLKKTTVLENIYGVDIVDSAVEIAKLRMWLSIIAELTEETAEMLDANELALPNIAFNVRQGNSLIGYTSFPEQTEAGEYTFERWSEESVRNRYEDIIEAKRKFRAATDRETASKYQREAFDLLAADREDLHENVLRDFERAGVEGLSESGVAAFDPFHWVLEFAEVYAEGGFDVVVGNPPWDVLSASRDDFFSRYDEHFRSYGSEMKDRVQRALLGNETVEANWETYNRNVEIQSEFFKDSTEYDLQTPTIGGGTATYKNELSSLFFERVFTLANDDGYVAQVLPGVIFNGQSSKDLRMKLLDESRVKALVEFENKGIFHEIDNRYRFGVVAFENHGYTETLRGIFEQRDLSILENFDERAIEIPREVLTEYSPEARIFPAITNPSEVDVLKQILTHPSVSGARADAWQANPLPEELNKTRDSDRFTRTEQTGDYPVYGGENIHQHHYDDTIDDDISSALAWSVEEGVAPAESAKRRIREKRFNTGEPKKALYERFGGPESRASQKQFVNDLLTEHRGEPLAEADVLLDCTAYRIAYRDVARSSDERTMIATVLPKGTVCVHTLQTLRPYEIVPESDNLSDDPLHGIYDRVFTDEELFVVAGLLNSLPFDFLMRTKIDTHIVKYKLEESQMPRLIEGDDWFEYIWRRAARLNCYGEAFAEMRERLGGIDPATDEDQRRELQAQIDAAAFHAYGLDREETQFVLDDFHRVQNPRLMTEDYFDLVSDHYDALAERDSA